MKKKTNNKDEITARLIVYGLPTMKGRELSSFKEWLRSTTKELTTEKDRKIFNKKYRATLYKLVPPNN